MLIHHIAIVTRLAGVLVTVSLLSLVVRGAFLTAQWRHLYEEVTRGRLREGASVRGLPSRYMAHLAATLRVLDVPYEEFKVRLWFRMALMGVLLLTLFMGLRYSLPVALALSIGLTLVVFERYYTSRARRAKERMLVVWLEQAVPVAVHVMAATQELAPAFPRMAALVKYAPLQKRLDHLAQTWNLPQYATAEDAFMAFAEDLGILEITTFALATREVRLHSVPLDVFWVEMADLLGLEVRYRERLRAETAPFRTGGAIFYGLLSGLLLVLYPFGQAYMSQATKVVFWFVLGVMTFGMALIVRNSQAIDV
ncbi:MAG: hypothetical protein ACYCYO_00220 [Bacilli bacterium]